MSEAPQREVVLLVGPGAIGTAIARRVATGRHLVVADLRLEGAERAARELRTAGFDTSAVECDLGSTESVVAAVEHAAAQGPLVHLVCAGGVSPSQASIEQILRVDLIGTAVLLEEVGRVVAPGGSGIVVSSQSGHRLPALTPEENEQLALTPVDELLALPMLAPDAIGTTLRAYQYAKRCNVLRVAAQATDWGRRGARLNSISPGIVMTPLALDEINGPRGGGYRSMIATMPARRAGTPDEIAAFAEFLLGPGAGFVTGTDVLADGGATAAYWYGDLRHLQEGWARS